MQDKFIWKVNKCQFQLGSDIRPVVLVQFIVKHMEGEYETLRRKVEYYPYPFTGNLREERFTPYEDLTEGMIVGWAEEDGFKKRIEKEMLDHVTLAQMFGFKPWHETKNFDFGLPWLEGFIIWRMIKDFFKERIR